MRMVNGSPSLDFEDNMSHHLQFRRDLVPSHSIHVSRSRYRACYVTVYTCWQHVYICYGIYRSLWSKSYWDDSKFQREKCIVHRHNYPSLLRVSTFFHHFPKLCMFTIEWLVNKLTGHTKPHQIKKYVGMQA